jgi:CRISPR system Cascade subunit CasC
LKRHWRVYDGENSLRSIDAPASVRSRVSFDRFVVEPLVAGGVDRQVANRAAQKLIDKVFGGEAKRQKADKKTKGKEKSEENAEEPGGTTSQVTVLGKPELDYLCQLAGDAIRSAGPEVANVEKELENRLQSKALRANLQALKPGSLEAGLGAALFGRMVTGDILSRTDAAVHVAHAMTVHGQMIESDYFTAIDDLIRDEGEQGSGHINASELTSGLFYGYVVIDVPGLKSNLGGDGVLAGEVAQRLVHIIATVSPGAKRGSTAPYAYSHLVMVEAGNAQPRTLQNAFIEPVPTSGNVIRKSYQVMEHHLQELDAMYGKSEQRAHAGLGTDGLFENKQTLSQLGAWAKTQVTQ